MNVINKMKNMGHIPKENRTNIYFENNVKSYHKYEFLSSNKSRIIF